MRFSTVTAASFALTSAVVLAVAPTLTTNVELAATLHYVRGTNIGSEPSEQQFEDFIEVVLDGTGTTSPDGPYVKVPYNAGLRPFSHGSLDDLTFDDSVQQGVRLLAAQQPAPGDVIFGFSQGAVVASQYKAIHSGNTYVLVANPSRPNGGVMQRLEGLTIPLLDLTFSGATPNNGDYTVDVTRQYDGWADFPAHLWNPVAVANAVAGIALVHGRTQTELTAADLEEARASGDSDYYQYDEASNTAYYVVKTYPVPLLMPLQSVLPEPVIAALDKPLRAVIETGYDRSDYSKPTRATLVGPLDIADPPASRVGVRIAPERPERAERLEAQRDDGIEREQAPVSRSSRDSAVSSTRSSPASPARSIESAAAGTDAENGVAAG